jgi:16S rRNA (guanine966-N2)-methyltransferase
MRVSAGSAKGRRLLAPKGSKTRPTTDAVREAIFNSLQSHVDFDGATVADLFAGSGALGIEAVSRGATRCTFVEHDKDALGAIEANLATTGFADAATVIRGDAAGRVITADVVFADPPYTFDAWPALAANVHARVFVVESDRPVDLGAPWLLVRSKRYGATVVSLFTEE